METLSKIPVADEYKTFNGKEAKLGRYTVKVLTYYVDNRYGSYERGFKFSNTRYGMLKRRISLSTARRLDVPSLSLYSVDHGKTWHESERLAKKNTKRGEKVKISSSKSTEFAFEGIQRINRSYDPNYRWRP